jgi:anaerobic selenocysteine-containing dehydrogenase
VNETTRHADVILPAPSPLYRSHYDLALYQLAARNVANYSPAVLESRNGHMPEWHTLLRLAGIAAGQGPDVDIDAFDDLVLGTLVARDLQDPASPLAGRDAEELIAELAPRRGPERMLDWMLRSGPYGDHFGSAAGGLTLATLEAAPHGIDLGPLEPRIPEVLRTESGKIDRLRAAAQRDRNGGMVLIGRRQLRSNNSWMHNVPNLVRGKERCTMHVHPDDAARLDLEDGGLARVTSERGTVEVPVEVTDGIMPGVVSIPHGWGHDDPEAQCEVAAEHPGTNSNVLADEMTIDVPSGNAVLNGIPVELAPVRAADAVPA